MTALNIWVDTAHAATLEANANADGFTLRYREAWAQLPQAFAFSPHLPFGQATHGASVKNFFSNLLPEGRPLEALSFAHQVSQYDVFGILRKVGRDCAGALVIVEDATTPLEAAAFNADDYEPVSESELQERIEASRAQDVPLMAWQGTQRMSLPGVQNKLGVYMAQNGALQLAKDSAPTSHILKIGNARHPDMAANEYACMRLAQRVGLLVPRVQYSELPEPILLVERYDRRWTPDGALQRIHQIDACQALNLPPEQKYEEPSHSMAAPGPAYAQLLALHKLCSTPAKAQVQLLQWLMFNFIIGNSDAHAKNFSFFVSTNGLQAAPLYDLVSGLRYGYYEMAQNIGGEAHLNIIGTEEWRRLAKDCAISFLLLQKLGQQLARRVAPEAEKLQLELVAKTTKENTDAIKFVCNLAQERAKLLLLQLT